MNMRFAANKTPVEGIKETGTSHLEELVLEILILILMINGTENRGKNLMSQIILIINIIAQIIMMLMLNNVKLNAEYH